MADCTRVAARFDQPGCAPHGRGYLVSYLGGIPVAELVPGDVQAMFTAITRELAAFGHWSSRDGGPLAWSGGG